MEIQMFRFGRSIVIGFLTMLVLNSCTTVRFQVPQSRMIPPDSFGMAHAGGRFTEKENRLLDEMGVSWIRATFRWDSIQKRTKQWDFRVWDRYVENAERAGKKILAVLAYDVPWIYGKEEKEARRHIEPDKIPYFLQYVEGVVRRYKGRIHAYEIWNEPNWLFWKGPDEDFFALARETARRIREVDPGAYIVAGSFWRVPRRFMKGMFRSGVFQYADAVSFHPYASSPEGVMALYDELREILEQEGFKGDIWVTEVGFPTGGWYFTRVSESRKPSYVIKTLAGLLVRGARVVFWYELFDKYPEGEAPSVLDSELYFGLSYPDFRPKSGAVAYALLARKIAGATYRPDLVETAGDLDDRLEVLPFLLPDGEKVLLVWSRTGESVPIRISPWEKLLQYHPATGRRETVPPGGKFTVGEEGIFLSWEANSRESPFTIQEADPESQERITLSGELSFTWKIR
ncbi:MAG: hypothetical protein Kow009_00860 [Spirochaetales bacterium]